MNCFQGLWQTIVRTWLRLTGGLEMFASRQERARRRAICRACPNNVGGWCQDVVHAGEFLPGCGCHLPSKTAVAASVCHRGRWTEN